MLRELFNLIDREELLEAAREGVPIAQYTLGQQYLNGNGPFEKSETLGALWLMRAHKNGCNDAETLLRWHRSSRPAALDI